MCVCASLSLRPTPSSMLSSSPFIFYFLIFFFLFELSGISLIQGPVNRRNGTLYGTGKQLKIITIVITIVCVTTKHQMLCFFKRYLTKRDSLIVCFLTTCFEVKGEI